VVGAAGTAKWSSEASNLTTFFSQTGFDTKTAADVDFAMTCEEAAGSGTDCEGTWSACGKDCADKTYTVTTPRVLPGAACEHVTGDAAPCVGEGDCPPECETADQTEPCNQPLCTTAKNLPWEGCIPKKCIKNDKDPYEGCDNKCSAIEVLKDSKCTTDWIFLGGIVAALALLAIGGAMILGGKKSTPAAPAKV
jgi:hypothetical protein